MYQGFTGRGFQGATGIQGYLGPQGVTGVQGFTGFQGFTGHKGVKGFTGFQGFTGHQGHQGIQGFTGFQGYTGHQGIQGFTGFQGFTGHQGVQGLTGFQGFTGFQGIRGYTGNQGLTGYQGDRGYTGYQGFTGHQGVRGFTGHQGFTGFQGLTGYQGIRGFQGVTGFGEQGLVGVTGFQGLRGSKGDGATATSYIRASVSTESTNIQNTDDEITINYTLDHKEPNDNSIYSINNGIFTIKTRIMANITYVTTVRMGGTNNPNVSVISFLDRKSSSGDFNELSNSRVGTSIVKTNEHKSSYTGSYIVQLNAGDQLKVTAKRTAGSNSADRYVTSQDTSRRRGDV